MKLRSDYPIYLNPTDAELIELGESRWDTLRVLSGPDVLVIASGYGNTHETLVQRYKRHSGGGKTSKRYDPRYQQEMDIYVGPCLDWESYIFFYDHRKVMLCNLGDVSGPEAASPSRWRREFDAERVRQFRLVAEASGLDSL